MCHRDRHQTPLSVGTLGWDWPGWRQTAALQGVVRGPTRQDLPLLSLRQSSSLPELVTAERALRDNTFLLSAWVGHGTKAPSGEVLQREGNPLTETWRQQGIGPGA